jgi:hypothetical protein
MNDTTQQPEPAVALQPRRAGELLGAALELYGRHPLTLIALVAAMVVPLSVLNWQAGCHPNQGCRITVLDGVVASTAWWTTIIWLVVPILLAAVVGAFLAVATRTITAQLAGQNPGIRRALRLGRTRPGWLLQAAVLVVVLVAALLVLCLPGMYLAGLDGPLPQQAVAANLLVIVVAGLYAGVRLAVSVPAAVVEGRRWPQALTRSWSLVDWHWGHVVATLLLAWLATGLVGSLLARGDGTRHADLVDPVPAVSHSPASHGCAASTWRGRARRRWATIRRPERPGPRRPGRVGFSVPPAILQRSSSAAC